MGGATLFKQSDPVSQQTQKSTGHAVVTWKAACATNIHTSCVHELQTKRDGHTDSAEGRCVLDEQDSRPSPPPKLQDLKTNPFSYTSVITQNYKFAGHIHSR